MLHLVAPASAGVQILGISPRRPNLSSPGADLVGLNCQYDPITCIKTMRIMKAALEAEKLEPFLMLQPLGFHAPEVEEWKEGYHELPEFPYCELRCSSKSLAFL